MKVHISISRMSVFQMLGVLDGIFHFIQNYNRTFCKQTVDLGLCCLPMSHKKDARLTWVNTCINV